MRFFGSHKITHICGYMKLVGLSTYTEKALKRDLVWSCGYLIAGFLGIDLL